MLQGRVIPIQLITDLLVQARQKRSGALLLHGEAGIGKTALLDYAVSQADGMTVIRGVGHQTEARLTFALLDQITRPLLPLLELLPSPQNRALKAALGLSEESVRDRFLISAAVLSLLAEAAERKPVLCIVDDLQWADQGSVDALVFAARRLEAEGVAMLMAARTDTSTDVRIWGVPHLELEGLDDGDALALIRTHFGNVPGPAVDRILANSGGNPLALIELPRVLDATTVADGGASLPDPLPVGAGIRHAFLEQVHALSSDGQGILAVAAADPQATCGEVLAVADRLGVDVEALTECERGRLVSIENERVVFRHPLIRAAAYYDSSAVARHRLHAAYADVLSAERDPERHVWHRSFAVEGPDELVAEALEAAAARCGDRGALETGGWAYERAAQLSAVSTRAAWRMLRAAEAAHLAGQPGRATELIERAGHLDDDPQLRIELDDLRGRLELRTGVPSDAHAYLISAARRVAPSDPVRAIQMLTEAGEAASYAGDRELIVATGQQAAFLMQGVEGAGRLPALVLFGSGKVVSGEAELGRSICREAVSLADQVTEPRDLVWASIAAQYAGDEVKQHALAARAASAARASGQVGMLPYALEFVALSELFAGRFSSARSTATEGLSLARELGQDNSIGRHLAVLGWVDAVQGHDEQCSAHCAEALGLSAARGLGLQAAAAHWALGLLELTLGRPADAYARLTRLLTPGTGGHHPGIALLACPDAVEAAVRSDQAEAVRPLVARFESFAGTDGPAWGRALAARCRGLLAAGADEAEAHFQEALQLHEMSSRPWDRARTHLLYGERLRRDRRRVDARRHLRLSAESFEELGAAPWLARARSELRATGETAHRRDESSPPSLTPQEFQIVGLVTAGSSNRDVAAQLFISPRTVEYHLSKVYVKVGVSSRSELAGLGLVGAAPS